MPVAGVARASRSGCRARLSATSASSRWSTARVKESPPDVKERRSPSGKPPAPNPEPSRLTSPGGVLPPRFELIEVGLDGILHDVNNAFDGVGQVVTSAGELRAVLLTSGGLNDLG